LLIVTGWITRP